MHRSASAIEQAFYPLCERSQDDPMRKVVSHFGICVTVSVRGGVGR